MHGPGSADFHGDGRLGDCRIKTGLGRIRVDQAGALGLKSGAGDVSVERATGRAEVTDRIGRRAAAASSTAARSIKNSNGDTWVGAVGGDLRLNAANGDIAVDLARASVTAKTANGDVRLGEVVRGSVVLETKIGDLEVGVHEGTAAWLDVSARSGRRTTPSMPPTRPEPSAETVEVRARTSVGDVVIRRA